MVAIQSLINRFIYSDKDDQLDRLLGRPDFETLKMNWVDDELTFFRKRFFNARPLFTSRKNKDENYSSSGIDQQNKVVNINKPGRVDFS
jgi:hypothetical protein